MDYTQDSWANYLENLDDVTSYYGFSAQGSTPEKFRLQAMPEKWAPDLNFVPEIDIVPEVEGDKIYFMPIVKVPPIDSRLARYSDDVAYCLKLLYKTNDLGGVCQLLLTHPYSIDKYTYEDEE